MYREGLNYREWEKEKNWGQIVSCLFTPNYIPSMELCEACGQKENIMEVLGKKVEFTFHPSPPVFSSLPTAKSEFGVFLVHCLIYWNGKM